MSLIMWAFEGEIISSSLGIGKRSWLRMIQSLMKEQDSYWATHLWEREREALIDISFKIAHDLSISHPSRPLVLDWLIDCEWVCCMRRRMKMRKRRCRIVSSHHRALLVLLGTGALSRSITWRNAIWMDSKMREDLEQELVRNHRHRRALIDQWSNHRHRRHRALHPWWCISMTIW